jgi:hypothetical protein
MDSANALALSAKYELSVDVFRTAHVASMLLGILKPGQSLSADDLRQARELLKVMTSPERLAVELSKIAPLAIPE